MTITCEPEQHQWVDSTGEWQLRPIVDGRYTYGEVLDTRTCTVCDAVETRGVAQPPHPQAAVALTETFATPDGSTGWRFDRGAAGPQ